MKRLGPYLIVFIGIFGLVLVLGKAAQRQQARARAQARAEKTEEARPEKSFPSWSETQECRGERGPVRLVFESKIKLDNLWDPFAVSGPVHRTGCDFLVGRIHIEDVTNAPDAQPEWWDENFCGEMKPAQLWRVTVFNDQLEPGEYVEDICWFWKCEGDNSHEGIFTCEISGLERVSLCQFRVADESECELKWDGCIDEDGNAGEIIVSGLLRDWGYSAGHLFTLAGQAETCLHKGTAANRYVTQELACNCYEIDLSDWQEYFWGGDAIGYGDGAKACWEAVNNFGGTWECLAVNWTCKTRAGGPHHTLDPAGRPWMAYEHEQNIRVVYRSSPQRQWHEVSPAFDEMGHSDPSILCFADGIIMVAARRLMGHTELKITPDGGKSWRRPGE